MSTSFSMSISHHNSPMQNYLNTCYDIVCPNHRLKDNNQYQDFIVGQYSVQGTTDAPYIRELANNTTDSNNRIQQHKQYNKYTIGIKF